MARVSTASRSAAPWRRYALGVGLFAIALAFVTLWPFSSNRRGPVILISIDTLRADRLPVYGYARGVTPHIDRLAADAVVFTRAWAHSPQTLPSHTSIFTGRWPFEHGVRDNVGFTLASPTPTLATMFRDAGYATGAFVSSFVLRRQVGLAQGFDTYDDMMPAAGPDRPLGMGQRPGTDTAASAMRWLQAQPHSTYFLFFHIYEPHTPYDPPVVPASGDRYDGEVTHADAIVGSVLDALRARGDYDAATIILLSDHGEGLGDHGEDEHGLFLYRTTIQTPLIVKLPGQQSRGRRVDTPVQHIDLLPTLAEAARLPALEGARGRVLRPLLTGEGSIPSAPIYAEAMSPRYHFGWSELYALTDERYRLIRAPRDELFDLETDPGEQTSQVTDRPAVHAAMRAALDQLIAGVDVTAPSAVSAADRQRLAALGYIGGRTGAATAGGTLADPKDKIEVLRQYQRASALGAAGRWTDAAAAYQALVRDEPDMIDAWLQLAQALERSGRRGDALEAYRGVLTREGKNAAALTGAATLLVSLGRFDDARAHAELAVDVAPATAHELLARLAVQRGDAEAARQHAVAGAAADATLPLPAFIDGLILYNQGAYAASIAPLSQAAEALSRRTEQLPDVRYLLGDALARENRLAEAERWFLAEVRDFPGHVRARAGLAMVRWTLGRRAEAIATVEALETDVGVQGPRVQGPGFGNPEADAAAAQLWALFGEPGRAAAARARAAGAR